MGIAATTAYVKSLLNGIPMPGGAPDMAAYIDAPDPNTETEIPAAYIWPALVDESRISVPRNTGPATAAGWKQEVHTIDVFVIWMGSSDDPQADSIFPGIVDSVMAALRTACPMPAIVADPYTGAETQLVDIGEAMRGQLIVSALEDEAYLRYDAKITFPATEEIQA